MNPVRGSAGRNDTYGIALTTQPGKSQGRPSTKAGSQPIVQDRPAHADSPGTPCPDGRTVQPGRSPVTRTQTAAPTDFIPGTNPIESTFSTVKLRTKVTRGAGSPAAALAMVFKLVESAQARWRAITGAHLVPLVRAGAKFESGVLVERGTVAA
jgi:hypothetical protein